MSWIKDNKFAALLGGVTLLVAIVLLYVGMTFRSNYSQALQSYQDAAAEVDEFESLPLYPSDANRDGKTKALNEYRAAITGLRNSFDKFRPKELKNIAPQDFTGNAKSAQEAVKNAFESAKTKLPDEFFLGFEDYASGSLAPGDATGILNFQLGAIKHLMLALAKTAPSQLQNLHRPKPPEEDGGKWVAGADDAYRAYPVEVTFKATEHSAREFLDALANSPDYFYCVRCLRLANDKNKAPNKADAKFEAAPGSAKAPASPFGASGAFVLPGDEPAPGPKPAPSAAPAKAADTGRILNQVLGDEQVEVFLRIDVLQFLPAKELPAVPK